MQSTEVTLFMDTCGLCRRCAAPLPPQAPAASDGTSAAARELGLALQQFDRLLAGTAGAFPWVDDVRRMHDMVQTANRAGVKLYWLESVLAAAEGFDQLSHPGALETQWQRTPWAAPKHRGWQEKYRRHHWCYSAERDAWEPPTDASNTAAPPNSQPQ